VGLQLEPILAPLYHADRDDGFMRQVLTLCAERPTQITGEHDNSFSANFADIRLDAAGCAPLVRQRLRRSPLQQISAKFPVHRVALYGLPLSDPAVAG
jgi:hypothetical protein